MQPRESIKLKITRDLMPIEQADEAWAAIGDFIEALVGFQVNKVRQADGDALTDPSSVDTPANSDSLEV